MIPPFSGVILFFVQTKEKYPKETAPEIVSPKKDLGIPSQLHDFLRSRIQDSCLGSAYLNGALAMVSSSGSL